MNTGLLNLPQSEGIKIFLSPHALDKLKNPTMPLVEHIKWLKTFRYFKGEAMTIALRPNQDSIEFHIIANRNYKIKKLMRDMNRLSDFLSISCCTYVSELDMSIHDFLSKRFQFESIFEGNYVKGIDGIKYKQYLLRRG